MGILKSSPQARPIGQSSLRVFPIAYGCWRFRSGSVHEARGKIEAAVEVGVQLFDHADIYGGAGAAEELFGRVLHENPTLRRFMVVATKCGIVPGVPYDASYLHLVRGAEESLRRLKCEVIDLFFVHRYDFLAHPEETARALEQLRQEGKIREAGVSNYTPSQAATLQRFLPFPLAAHQREWSCTWPNVLLDGTVDQCFSLGLGLLAWSPLAGGKLLLSVEQAQREHNASVLVPVMEKLDELAQRYGTDRAAVALSFLLVHPVGAIPIVGTQRVERIRRLRQVFDVRWERHDWYAVLQAGLGRKLP